MKRTLITYLRSGYEFIYLVFSTCPSSSTSFALVVFPCSCVALPSYTYRTRSYAVNLHFYRHLSVCTKICAYLHSYIYIYIYLSISIYLVFRCVYIYTQLLYIQNYVSIKTYTYTYVCISIHTYIYIYIFLLSLYQPMFTHLSSGRHGYPTRSKIQDVETNYSRLNCQSESSSKTQDPRLPLRKASWIQSRLKLQSFNSASVRIQDALNKTPWHSWILDVESGPRVKCLSGFKRDLKIKYSWKTFP